MLESILLFVVTLFPLSELALALMKRSRGRSAQSEDKGSLRLLWISIMFGVALAMAARVMIPSARLPVSLSITQAVALALMLSGLAVRWAAILTLGKLFTVDVAIHADHEVVQRGLYRFMRHPSYTGLLLAFLGFGFFFANWLSILGLLVPITLGVMSRVAKEERALRSSLGPAYVAYCARTSRFIPGLL